MATNLRLRPDVAAAVKAEAARTGRSQQDVMRDAIEAYLTADATSPGSAPVPDEVAGLANLGLIPPRAAWRRAATRIRLAPGVSSSDLLDRKDRI
ncbi:MAG TPA: ribbon-helix-helix protein, CopG family [Microbacteriaceae bacterium]